MGIPMGTDYAPLSANLFLFFYEYYIQVQEKLDKRTTIIFLARRFNNTMRYIDDLLIPNNIQ